MKVFVTTCIGFAFMLLVDKADSCGFPDYLHGKWYYMQFGYGKTVNISSTRWGRNFYCLELYNHSKITPNAKIVIGEQKLHFCTYLGDCILQRTGLKVSDCPGVSQRIIDVSQMTTMFRVDSPVNVSCKEPFDGRYQFTYEMNFGGGGVCDNKSSLILPYDGDDRLFQMNFKQCPDVETSMTKDIVYQCYGRWEVFNRYVLFEYAVIADVNERDNREKFKCLMTQKNLRDYYGNERWVMSRFVDCSRLSSAFDGPVKLVLKPACAYGLSRDLTYQQCLTTYDMFIMNIKELASSPIYTNPNLLQSLCSMEGRATLHCMLEAVEKCPGLSKGYKSYFNFDVLDIVNMGGLNQTCHVFLVSCSDFGECVSDEKLEALHQSLSTLGTGSHMGHSAAFKQSEILCGPLKTMYECMRTKLSPCNVDQHKTMMLLQYYGSTNNFKVDNTSTTFITEKCGNVENVNNTCVSTKIATKEFTDCLTSSINITDACSMYREYTACINDIVSADCGKESGNFIRDALVQFELNVPESCLHDISFANRNAVLSGYILGLMIVTLIGFL